MAVEPARLESTCHVFAHGLDVFYTRWTPAKAFDSLGDDFGYMLLVLAMIALAIGAFLLAHTSERAMLKQKWA